MGNKFVKTILPLAVILGSAGGYALLQVSRPPPDQNPEAARPTTVYVTEATESSAALEVTTQGEVRSRTQIDLVAEVGGRVVSVSPEFVKGGRIEPGATLLQIEDTDYRLAQREAQARVADAELAVQQALADQDVARRQLRGDPDPSDLALKKPQVAQARAMRDAAQAGLEQAELDLARTRVSLPFRGRVAETHVQVGQYITPGTPLAEVFGTDLVEVRLPLTNAQLATLGLPIGYTAGADGGLPVTFTAEVAGRRHEWRGALVRLDASVDPQTRLLYAIAEVRDPYASGASAGGMPLAVGLYVDARIHGGDLVHAISIPGSALRAGDVVYVVNTEGLLDIRHVQVAQSTPERALISSGLAAGDRVVTSAIRNPVQGMSLSALDRTEG